MKSEEKLTWHNNTGKSCSEDIMMSKNIQERDGETDEVPSRRWFAVTVC